MVWKYQGRTIALMLVLVLTALGAAAQTQRPTILFTDLQSGPNTGGENNNGTILTIYGKNFGLAKGTGTVTVGGGAVAQYYLWGVNAPGELGIQKISVGLGPAASTGTVVVTTVAGPSTCGNTIENCQFTVRPGNIRCVSTTGSDNNAGTFPSSCWASLHKAAYTISAGDIAYAMNGVSATALDNYSAALWLGDAGSGSAGNPKALVAYPGATVSVGSDNLSFGIRGSVFHAANDYWLIAGLALRSSGRALGGDGINNWRVIGTTLYCPQGGGSQGCFEPDSANYWTVLGNYMHDTGTNTKFYHGIYFSTDDNHIELAWNTVANIQGCRGIQFHSSPVNTSTGYNEYDLSVHDNIVHDIRCDGINMATIDPSKGAVKVYNNIVYRAGKGPVPSDGGGNFSCIYFADVTNNGADGTGTAQAYNNTLYDCGSASGGVSGNQTGAINKGGYSSGLLLSLSNNIVQTSGGESYLSSSGGSGLSQISGTNNLWFGNGSGPSQTKNNVSADPLFVSIGSDFHLQANSPAIGAGSNTLASAFDLGGLFRPTPPSIGAYELTAAVPPVRPNPPTNLSVVVN